MELRWLLAAVHLLAFAVTFASIIGRTRALRRAAGGDVNLQAVFRSDAGWGLGALVLIVTGLTRAFGGVEKGSDYYLHAPLFHLKMGLLLLILILEVPPMLAQIRWRAALRRGETPDLSKAAAYARIGVVQFILLIGMVVAATGMARGFGLPDGQV